MVKKSAFGIDVLDANQLERVILREAETLTNMILDGVHAVMRAGRPLFTQQVPEADRLANLLLAPRPWWEALEEKNPELAAAMVAEILKAREAGKIPAKGPLADQVGPDDNAPSKLETPASEAVVTRQSRSSAAALNKEEMT